MFSLVITIFWQKVNDVALNSLFHSGPEFFGVIFRHKTFGSSILRYLYCLLFISSMNYYYYLLSCVIFCDL
jgi:hypothetical protein